MFLFSETLQGIFPKAARITVNERHVFENHHVAMEVVDAVGKEMASADSH